MTAVIQIVANKEAISNPECEPVEHDRTSDAAAAHLTTRLSVREQRESTRADASSEAGVSLALLRLARRRQLDVKH
jgi:hypothetical protein